MQVLPRYFVEAAYNGPLKQREGGFNRVCVNIAAHVFADYVIHRLMAIGEPWGQRVKDRQPLDQS